MLHDERINRGFRRCLPLRRSSSIRVIRAICGFHFLRRGGSPRGRASRASSAAGVARRVGAGFVQKRRDLREHLRRGVFQDELGLVFDREQVLHAAFADEDAMRENADAIANFLHLREEMGGKQDGDAAPFQIENQIANLARAGRIDARGRLVEHDKPGFLDERLRESDPLQHALGITAEPPIARILQANEREQFVRARFQLLPAQTAEFSVKTERLFAGQIFVEIGILRQKTDCFAAPHFAAVAAEDFARARRGATRPRIIFKVVLLPDPLGPSRP